MSSRAQRRDRARHNPNLAPKPGRNGAKPERRPRLSGIQLALLELATLFGHPSMQSSTGEQIGGSPEAWLAWVQAAPPPDLLGVLAVLVNTARQQMGAAPAEQPARPHAPRLYGPGGQAVL